MPREQTSEWTPPVRPPLTAVEIAELYGMTENGVNTLIRRAIERLRWIVAQGGVMSRDVKFFCECKRCGERWEVARGQLDVSAIGRTLECPNCWAGPKEITLCPTEGEGAVTEPRTGGPEFARRK